MQTCSTMRPFSMTTIWSAVLNGGEPMSNHDGSALVRNTVERLPPQSFALGVARGSRLIKQQHRCVQHRREHPLCPAGGLARRAGRDQSAAGEDNQILRHGGRTADGSSVAWAVAAKQVQVALKFVSSESRPRFVACMVRTAPRCKRHRGREIVLDAEQASVWRNRRAGRISEVDDGLLRTALYDAVHIILTTQGLFTTEELGDADRQARRHEQGQGGFARRLAVIMHRVLAERAPSTLQQSDRRRATVRARHHAFSKRSAFAGTMDHVRQNYKN